MKRGDARGRGKGRGTLPRTPLRDFLKEVPKNFKNFPRKGRIFALRNPALSGENFWIYQECFQAVSESVWGKAPRPSPYFSRKKVQKGIYKREKT